MRTCSVKGCNGKHEAKGFCTMHYVKFKIHGDPLYVTPVKLCSIKGCEKKYHSKGFCQKHCNRFKRQGDPLVTLYNKNHSDVCSIEGCTKKYEANGFCNAHYIRFRKHGDPFHVRKIISVCSIEGCMKKYDAKGFCRYHYHKFKKYGDPLYVIPTIPLRLCDIEGCKKKHKSNGYCDKHNFRFKKHGDPLHVRLNRDHDNTCKIEGCNGKYHCKGFCKYHYSQSPERTAYQNSDQAKANRKKSRLKKFNLTLEEFDEIVEQQNNKCAICRNRETIKRNGIVIDLSVDHNHETNKVRELLCMRCNVRLGQKEDEKWIKLDNKYLEKHSIS